MLVDRAEEHVSWIQEDSCTFFLFFSENIIRVTSGLPDIVFLRKDMYIHRYMNIIVIIIMIIIITLIS